MALDDFRSIFAQVWDLVDQETFYNVYRPLLSGTPPQGMLLRGVGPGEGKTVHCKGPSAGQSAVFYLIDGFLGVRHEGEVRAFKEEMLEHYIPRDHKVALPHSQRHNWRLVGKCCEKNPRPMCTCNQRPWSGILCLWHLEAFAFRVNLIAPPARESDRTSRT